MIVLKSMEKILIGKFIYMIGKMMKKESKVIIIILKVNVDFIN